MPENPLALILRRPPGEGWLILSGGPLSPDLRLRIPEILTHAGTAVCLVPSRNHIPQAEPLFTSWLDELGWTGSVLVCESPSAEAEEQLREKIAEASFLFLPDIAPAAEFVAAIQDSDLTDSLLAALEEGAAVLAEGTAAEIFGDWICTPPDEFTALGWLPGIILQAHFAAGTACPPLRRKPGLVRVGLADDDALALGPDSERQIWGSTPPTFTFGVGWNA